MHLRRREAGPLAGISLVPHYCESRHSNLRAAPLPYVTPGAVLRAGVCRAGAGDHHARCMLLAGVRGAGAAIVMPCAVLHGGVCGAHRSLCCAQEFMELVRQERMLEAIAYSRRHLSPWADLYQADLQRALAALAFRAGEPQAGSLAESPFHSIATEGSCGLVCTKMTKVFRRQNLLASRDSSPRRHSAETC